MDGFHDPDLTLIPWRNPHEHAVEHIYCECCGMFTAHRLIASDGAAVNLCLRCIGRHLIRAIGT